MDYKQILGLNADNGPHPGPTPQYPHFAHPAEYYSGARLSNGRKRK